MDDLPDFRQTLVEINQPFKTVKQCQPISRLHLLAASRMVSKKRSGMTVSGSILNQYFTTLQTE